MKATVVKVINASKRSGEGKNGPWNIMEVEVKREDGSLVNADTFDTVVDGDAVELEPNNYTNPTTGKTYNGWNAKIPKAPRPGGGGADNGAVLEAVRMVFREVKEVKAQNAEILYGIKALMGPADDVPESATEAEPEEGPTRDWQNVGKGADEPTVEPLPEEPEDLASFMNG